MKSTTTKTEKTANVVNLETAQKQVEELKVKKLETVIEKINAILTEANCELECIGQFQGAQIATKINIKFKA